MKVETIERGVAFGEKHLYVYRTVLVEKDGTASTSRRLINKDEFRAVLKQYKWAESTRKIMGSTFPYVIRLCDEN